MSERYDGLQNIIPVEGIKCNEALSRYTTFHIGGPADRIVFPKNVTELSGILLFCNENAIPYYMIGNGSNLLVSDKGYRGIIISLKEWNNTPEAEEKDGTMHIRAGAGIMLSYFANDVAGRGCSGLEFASGIPGTLGGAIVMNAGAYGGEISQTIVSATVMDKSGNTYVLDNKELELGYRTSVISGKEYIVLDGTFELKRGQLDSIRSYIEELKQRRKEKQPLEYPSAGSTFKRPEGYFAGKLIMEAGLRGFRVGDAMVSEKHCGFVINAGHATALQVRELIDRVIDKVKLESGVVLEPEVKFLGEM